VECSSSTSCQISIFQSSLPNTYHKYSLQMIPPKDGSGNPVPISASNSVEFKYESVSATITCNDTWQSLPPVAPASEIQNQIKCTVGSSRTQVNVYLKLYDQDTYANTYSSPPSYTYFELNNADETSPVCTKENILAASAACKWQKQNANNSLLNQQGVPMNSWVVYARTAVDGLSMGYSVDSGDASPYESSDSVCAVDSNGNGTVDSGEMQACVQIGETQFCPVDAVECIATHSDAICPSGSVLNASKDKCEASPNINCPAGGYTYNSDVDTCAMEVTCPDGGGLNPNSDLCEIVVTSDLCPAGYTYNSTLDACTKAVLCVGNGTYSGGADQCELPPDHSCPDGYSYNLNRNICEVSPTCSHGTYNASTDRCELGATERCPSGYTYNSLAGKCLIASSCPVNGALNTSRDLCETVYGYDCPTGYTYNSSLSLCQKDPVCNQGTYNASTNQCELAASVACPSGYTYNSSAGKCVISVSCPNDGSLNTTRDKCEVAYTPTCASGYTYNSSRGKCEANPVCPSGTSYNTTYNVCLKAVSSITCPSGYIYNSSRQKCEKAPGCPSGSSYNSSTNRCETAISWSTSYCTISTLIKSCNDNWCTDYNQDFGSYPSCSATSPRNLPANSALIEIKGHSTWDGEYQISKYYQDYLYRYGDNQYCTISTLIKSCNDNWCTDYNQDFGSYPSCSATSPRNLPANSALIEIKGHSTWDGEYQISKYYQDYLYRYGDNQYCTISTLIKSCNDNWCTDYNQDFGSYPSCSATSPRNLPANSALIEIKGHSTWDGEYQISKYYQDYLYRYNTGSCPSGYTENSAICAANATCSSGGTLNASVDKCQYVPTYNCDSGYTYDLAIEYCKINATCSSSGTLNTSVDNCQLPYSQSCPSGYSYNSTYGVCQESPPCPSGSAYDNLLGQCARANTLSCPSGMTLTVSTCYMSAMCADGSLNTTRDKCEVAYTATCETGYTYNSSLGVCQTGPVCPSGSAYDSSLNQCTVANTWGCPSAMSLSGSTCYISVYCPVGGNLNTNTELCEAADILTCFTEGYSYSNTFNKCVSAPICDYGYFDGSIDLCRLSASGICPGSYTYNNNQNKCLLNPPCLSGALYSTTLNQCSINAIHDCPDNTSYTAMSRLCEAYPMCEVGSYNPDTNSCYEGNNTCPYGTQYPCLEYQGKNQCSAKECVQYGDSTETEGDPPGSNDKQDDGQYSEDGTCLGQIYIFNGNDRRCRSGGLTIGFENCCQDEDYLFGLGQCKQEEIQLAKLKGKGLCHEIGEYCSREIKLGFIKICIEHSKSYCCFNSKLSRITHEQGRPQMKTDVSNWGAPEGPHCRGFIPEEFQMLDFSRIDLSEWYGDIVPTAQGQVKNNMQQSVQRFYDKVN